MSDHIAVCPLAFQSSSNGRGDTVVGGGYVHVGNEGEGGSMLAHDA